MHADVSAEPGEPLSLDKKPRSKLNSARVCYKVEGYAHHDELTLPGPSFSRRMVACRRGLNQSSALSVSILVRYRGIKHWVATQVHSVGV